MCEHDWQYSDNAQQIKMCTKCGAVTSKERLAASVDTDEVERVYHVADLPDPMGSNRRIKIWGS